MLMPSRVGASAYWWPFVACICLWWHVASNTDCGWRWHGMAWICNLGGGSFVLGQINIFNSHICINKSWLVYAPIELFFCVWGNERYVYIGAWRSLPAIVHICAKIIDKSIVFFFLFSFHPFALHVLLVVANVSTADRNGVSIVPTIFVPCQSLSRISIEGCVQMTGKHDFVERLKTGFAK